MCGDTAISVSWYIEEGLSYVGCGSDTWERRCGLALQKCNRSLKITFYSIFYINGLPPRRHSIMDGCTMPVAITIQVDMVLCLHNDVYYNSFFSYNLSSYGFVIT